MLSTVSGTRRSTSPWYFVIIGIIAMGFGVFSYVQQKSFMEKASETTGKVIEIRQTRETVRRNNTRLQEIRYRPVIEFTVNGQSLTILGGKSEYSSSYSVGQQISVLYNPENPSDAQIKKKVPQMVAYISGGVVALIAGIFMLVKRKKATA